MLSETRCTRTKKQLSDIWTRWAGSSLNSAKDLCGQFWWWYWWWMCVWGVWDIFIHNSFLFGGSASYDRDDDVLVVTMPKQNIQKAWVPLDRAPRVIWQFYEVASQDGWQWCPCWIERSLFTTWNRISRKTRMVLTYSRLYIQTKFDSKSRSMHLI